MAPKFHDLKVAEIRRDTPDAVAIAFEPPADADFTFIPGQHLTLRAEIDGQDIRRSYSICSPLGAKRLEVGVKRVEDGRFSRFVNDRLAVGDVIRVMPPEGRFAAPIGGAHDYLLIAAGSGITPILSIARSVLEGEPESRVTLLYGNRDTASIMFREALEDLKDRFLGRFTLIHVLSREAQDVELLHGRIDPARLGALAKSGAIEPKSADSVFICGPGEMIDAAAKALEGMGVDPARIHHERFTPAEDAAPRAPSAAARKAAETGAVVETLVDGARHRFTIRDAAQSVLDAAHAAGLELPYSCAGGMCCTCRCNFVEGGAEMAVNYSLEPWEIEAGYTLACQSRPTTPKLVLDFDAV
jgi:ring-1,2-phenylacetyl-CoA epoxidase subunit PaaE